MRWLTDTVRLRLLLALMGVLEAAFLIVRARPYGADAHPLLLLVVGLTAATTLAIVLVPERTGERLLALLLRATATPARAVVLLLAATLAVGLAGVLTQQANSWDERSVLWAADVFAEGGPAGLFARYGENAWLGPQHPPLVPILYGTVTSLGGSHLKLLRLVNLVFGCGTVVVTYLIFRSFHDRVVALLAALLLLASPLFVRIASAATNDMPLTFLFCLAVLLALRLQRTGSDGTAVALGVVLGLGLLVKYTMVLVLPVLVAIGWSFGSLPRLRRHAPLVLAIAFSFLLAWLDHAWALGILDAQQQRLGRLAGVAWRSPHWVLDALVSKMPAALGVDVVPWIACGALAALRRRAAEDRFVLLWIVLVSVPLLLTLPDNRYFLPAFPALAVLAARMLAGRPRWTAHVLVLALLLCAITTYFYARIDLGRRAFLFG